MKAIEAASSCTSARRHYCTRAEHAISYGRSNTSSRGYFYGHKSAHKSTSKIHPSADANSEEINDNALGRINGVSSPT